LRRYRSVLKSLIDGLVTSGNGRFVTHVLADAPAVSDQTLGQVAALCADADKLQRQTGLSCLRALIVHHPARRDECLARLLAECVVEDDAARSPVPAPVAPLPPTPCPWSHCRPRPRLRS